MGHGYFDDGTVDVELGEHMFVTPGFGRRNVVLDPHSDPATVLDSGGGIIEIEVTGQRVRANLGDAERYIYELLLDLAESGAGDLAHEDNRGHQSVFGDSICVSGEGEVQGSKFADMRFDFQSPEKSSEPAWGAVPATPGTYGGTSTLRNYAAGGVSLGVGGELRIGMSRAWPLREIPRARGARTSVPPRGAVMRFVVRAATISGAANLALTLENLVRTIGPRPVDLTGNGNTYCDVVLRSARPRHTDRKFTLADFEFLQQI